MERKEFDGMNEKGKKLQEKLTASIGKLLEPHRDFIVKRLNQLKKERGDEENPFVWEDIEKGIFESIGEAGATSEDDIKCMKSVLKIVRIARLIPNPIARAIIKQILNSFADEIVDG